MFALGLFVLQIMNPIEDAGLTLEKDTSFKKLTIATIIWTAVVAIVCIFLLRVFMTAQKRFGFFVKEDVAVLTPLLPLVNLGPEWWKQHIFPFLELSSIDSIRLRYSCKLFRDSLAPPLWTVYPHPNYSTLKKLIERINELWIEDEARAPAVVFIANGTYRTIEGTGPNTVATISCSLALIGKNCEKTIVYGGFHVIPVHRNHGGNTSKINVRFESMKISGKYVHRNNTSMHSMYGNGLSVRSYDHSGATMGVSVHALNVLVDDCHHGVAVVAGECSLTNCQITNCDKDGILASQGAIINIYGVKSKVTGNCKSNRKHDTFTAGLRAKTKFWALGEWGDLKPLGEFRFDPVRCRLWLLFWAILIGICGRMIYILGKENDIKDILFWSYFGSLWLSMSVSVIYTIGKERKDLFRYWYPASGAANIIVHAPLTKRSIAYNNRYIVHAPLTKYRTHDILEDILFGTGPWTTHNWDGNVTRSTNRTIEDLFWDVCWVVMNSVMNFVKNFVTLVTLLWRFSRVPKI